MWKIKKRQNQKKIADINDEPGEYAGKIIQYVNRSYVLINILGIGAYATVWMCYSTNKKELFAMKIFKPKEKKNATKEIEIYDKFSKMNVKHIVTLHDSFEKDGKMCIVLDLMAGSLYDFTRRGSLDDNTTFELGFTVDFAISTLHSVLETLVDLHSKGIIHGDIKTDNILLFGRTKMHADILKNLSAKSSVKKISESVKEMCKSFVVINKDSESSSSCSYSESSSYDNERKEKKSKRTNSIGDNDNGDESTSDMSSPPHKIILSAESDDSESNSHDSHDGHDEDKSHTNHSISEHDIPPPKRKILDHLKIPNSYTVNPVIKLADMGSYVDIKAEKKPIAVQTKYYKSPELILGLKYDTSCDIWALGCTVYEILTGEILFNQDGYDIDKKRCLLHLIYASLGKISEELIDQSPFRQLFFTDNYTLKENSVYGDNLYLENKWITFLDCGKLDITPNETSHDGKQIAVPIKKSNDTVKKYLLLDLMLDMLNLDPKCRITASDALRHPLFKLCLNKN